MRRHVSGTRTFVLVSAAAPMHCVELKANPAKDVEFLFLAILVDGRRDEGRSLAKPPYTVSCDAPNRTCMGCARTRSSIEFGATHDD
jgi:hypothetical protein